MSTNDSTRLSRDEATPRLYTAWSGAEIAGTSAHAVKRNIKPDAWMVTEKSDENPLFTEATLRAFRAAKELQAAPEAHDAR